MVKVAVPSTPPGGLDAQVDPRFGRCMLYTIVDIVDTNIKNVEVIENTAARLFSGAGIQAAQLVASKGVKVVICGSMGPNAYYALQQVGVSVYTGVPPGITVREAIKLYSSGRLSSQPMPGGFGRGMGMGRGRMWMTMPPSPTTTFQQPATMTKEQEKEILKQQLKFLEEQLKAIKKRLEELE